VNQPHFRMWFGLDSRGAGGPQEQARHGVGSSTSFVHQVYRGGYKSLQYGPRGGRRRSRDRGQKGWVTFGGLLIGPKDRGLRLRGS